MLKKFAFWFICFGLSFLVENWGWTEQGKAFLYIHLGVGVVFVLILVAIAICVGMTDGRVVEAGGVSFVAILLISLEIGIVLLATWGATKLFNVNFYVVYQIMTFGQCLCTSKKED